MNATQAAFVPGRRRRRRGALIEAVATPRLVVYALCVLGVVSISYLLGKDMMWDTLDYHLYAGFSALHDRFGQDYFAAGSQSYFNPYVYVPFYLLATAGISALTAASVLAAVQAGILWLSYELALALVPDAAPRARIAIGICTVLLTLDNPILINQLGTSSADLITAELVLAGWLCLVRALVKPSHGLLACAGVLLGAASALKLTNSVHAVSACALLPFLPAPWRQRLRSFAAFGLAMTCGFAIIAAPWSMHLARHFGNPFFPLLNGAFRSPQFPSWPLQDLRFVPDSLGAALWRPFATIAPVSMVDDEFAAPDLRYAVLVALTLAALIRWSWRWRFPAHAGAAGSFPRSAQLLMALGSGLLLDWSLWLTASGNARYFTAMASVAAVLVIVLMFRLCASRVRLRNYLVAALFVAQTFEACLGASYRDHVAWDGGPWFEISAPAALAAKAALYFDFEEQSNSFVIPFLAPGSGFINLDGDYVLSSRGANGRHIRRMIAAYRPSLRVLTLQTSASRRNGDAPPDLSHENDTLAHFGLRVDTAGCTRVRIRDIQSPWTTSLKDGSWGGTLVRVAQPTDAFLVTCRAVPRAEDDASLMANEAQANLVFERLEHACPALFQPRAPVTLDFGDARQGYTWIRRYGATGLSIVITGGIVRLMDPLRGGRATYLGRESDWQQAPLGVSCRRRGQRYYATLR